MRARQDSAWPPASGGSRTTAGSSIPTDQVFAGDPMPRIAGLEEVECYCTSGSEHTAWDEVPRLVVDHSKSNAAGRTEDERDTVVEIAERLGGKVQVDAVIKRQLLAVLDGGAWASYQGADQFGQRVGV